MARYVLISVLAFVLGTAGYLRWGSEHSARVVRMPTVNASVPSPVPDPGTSIEFLPGIPEPDLPTTSETSRLQARILADGPGSVLIALVVSSVITLLYIGRVFSLPPRTGDDIDTLGFKH